jgi:hypothetical protein
MVFCLIKERKILVRKEIFSQNSEVRLKVLSTLCLPGFRLGHMQGCATCSDAGAHEYGNHASQVDLTRASLSYQTQGRFRRTQAKML